MIVKLIHKLSLKLGTIRFDKRLKNEKQYIINVSTGFLYKLMRSAILLAISYVLLSPFIGIIASSFFSNADKYSPIVYLIPQAPTLEKYRLTIARLDFWNVLGNMLVYVSLLTLIQVFICSLVGYGFARFTFPFKKLLFACVIVMIVIPPHSVMLPLYMSFQNFNPFGIISLLNAGRSLNLLSTPFPMIIMTLFACGLRSGLYIYIFNQFFRGLPKEIEEAALIDGAGLFYTYFFVMIPNAMPSVVTVSLFSLVWQYNDTFFARLFLLSPEISLGKKINSLQANLVNLDRILDPSISMLYLYAGIVLTITPLIILYSVLQKRFIEGVERSGIVG